MAWTSLDTVDDTGTAHSFPQSDPVPAPRHRELHVRSCLNRINGISGTYPKGSIDCVVTSPPYWALRNYGSGSADEIGAEPTIDDYVDKMVRLAVYVELVLKPTGTFWLNLGDLYAGPKKPNNLSPKCLMALPHRVLVAIIERTRLTCRNDIIWRKKNAMPLPVEDRLVSTHEHLFLFSKTDKYHFDLDSIRVPTSAPVSKPFNRRTRDGAQGRLDGSKPQLGTMSNKERMSATQMATNTGLRPNMSSLKRGNMATGGSGMKNPGDVLELSPAAGLDPWCVICQKFLSNDEVDVDVDKQTRNCRHCGTKPVEHVAPFPVELPMWCIKAGCPEGGMVMDPFMGSGTTALAAERLGRNWTGFELSDQYADLCRRRLAAVRNARLDDDK